MHGMEPDEEIVYWRAMARRVEAERDEARAKRDELAAVIHTEDTQARRERRIAEHDRDLAKLEVERMRAVYEAAKELGPHLKGTGDWVCEVCRPESDMLHISPGFRCRPHALQDALAALDSPAKAPHE